MGDPNDFWGRGGSSEPNKPRESGLRDKQEAAEGGFWSKEMAAPQEPARSGDGGFWEQAESRKAREQEERETLLRDPDIGRRRRRRIVRRTLLGALAVLLLGAVLGVIFLPQIASALAPGMIARRAGEHIAGSLTVGATNLSWGGPQRISGLRLADPAGKEVLRANVETDAGLWGLIRGRLDLGEVRITGGHAEVVRGSDGRTNIERAVAGHTQRRAGAAGPAEEPRLPDSLRARLVVKGLDVGISDETSHANLALRDIDIVAKIAPGEPLSIKASMLTHEGGITGRAPDTAGEVSLDARIEKWSGADGRITLGKARGNASLQARGLPTSLVDAFAPAFVQDEQGGTLRMADALGRACALDIRAESDGEHVSVDFEVSLPEASAKGHARITRDDVTITGPTTLRVSGKAGTVLVPNALGKARDAGVEIESLPDLEALLDGGRFVFPLQGKLDLRGAGVRGVLSAKPWSARLELPGQDKAGMLRVNATSLRIEADDLGRQARVQVRTGATLDGSPAGDLTADITIGGLLDAQGEWSGIPASLTGSATIANLATGVIQPFVAQTGLDLPSDIGPNITAHLEATSRQDQGRSVSSVSFEARTAHADARGSIEILPTAIRTGSEGFTLRLSRSGSIASRLVKPDTGWEVVPDGGAATITITHAAAPREPETGRVRWEQVGCEARFDHGLLTLRRTEGGELAIAGADAALALRPGGRARLQSSVRASYNGSEFRLATDLEAPGLYTSTPEGGIAIADLATVRPTGTVEITGISPGAASLFIPAGDARAGEIVGFVEHAFGGATDVRISATPVKDRPEALDARVEVQSAGLRAKIEGAFDAHRAAIKSLNVNATVTPQVAADALRLWGGDLEAGVGRPALSAPTRVALTLEPMDIPLDAWRPVLERTPLARGRFTLSGQARVEGLTIRREDGTTGALGPIGAEDLDVRFEIPVAALVAPPLTDQRHASATLRGKVLGKDGPVMSLDAEVRCEVSAGRLAGPLTVRARTMQVVSREVDSLLALDGLTASLLGESADVDFSCIADPPPTGTGEPWFPANARFDATLGVTSSRLRTDKPLRVRVSPNRLEVLEAASLSYTPDLDALNAKLRAGSEHGPATVLECETMVLRIARCSIPLPDAAGNRAPPSAPRSGAAEVALSFEAPLLVLRPDGGQRATLRAIRLEAATERITPDRDGRIPQAGPSLVYTLSVGESGVEGNEPAKGMTFGGRVTNLLTINGPDPGTARFFLRGEAPAVPTVIVDAALRRDGEFVDLLGPVISLKVDIAAFPLLPPRRGPDGKFPVLDPLPVFDLDAQSTRASASIRGSFREGMFVSERAAEITIREITSTLVQRYVGVTPAIGTVEKTPEDDPAIITVSGLTIPLDRDWSRLNAIASIDLGQCRFQASGHLTHLLKAARQKVTGVAGTRVEPLTVVVRDGVATYGRWRLPLGEFTIQTAGAANFTTSDVRAMLPDGREGSLPAGHIDVVTWIPAGALTDKALGMFNIGIGSLFARLTPGLLEPLTLLPFRTRGPMGNPNTSAAVDLVGKDVVDQLKKLDPRRLLPQQRPETQPENPR